MALASVRNTLPSSVSSMPRPMRLNSLASCRLSSAAIAALTADWVKFSASAARVMCCRSATATRSEAAQASCPSSYHNPAAAHPTRKDSPRVTFRAMRRRGHIASTPPGSLSANGADRQSNDGHRYKESGALRVSWPDQRVSLMSARESVAMKRNARAPRTAGRSPLA